MFLTAIAVLSLSKRYWDLPYLSFSLTNGITYPQAKSPSLPHTFSAYR